MMRNFRQLTIPVAFLEDTRGLPKAGKPCGRCGGSMSVEADAYGDYWDCLQCGDQVDLPRKRKPGRPMPGSGNIKGG